MAITCFKTFTVDSGCNSCDMLVEAVSADSTILSRMFGVVVDNPVGEDGSGLTSYTGSYATVANYIWFGGQSTLTTLSFPNLTAVATNGGSRLNITDNAVLTSFSAPLLVDGGALTSNFIIRDNASLTSIDLSALIMEPGKTYDFRNNALPAAMVNAILARGAASLPAFTGGSLLLQGGTNAAPTGQGIIDKAAIAGNGNVCTTT